MQEINNCHDCPYFDVEFFYGQIIQICNEGSVYFGSTRFADNGLPELCPLKNKQNKE